MNFIRDIIQGEQDFVAPSAPFNPKLSMNFKSRFKELKLLEIAEVEGTSYLAANF